MAFITQHKRHNQIIMLLQSAHIVTSFKLQKILITTNIIQFHNPIKDIARNYLSKDNAYIELSGNISIYFYTLVYSYNEIFLLVTLFPSNMRTPIHI